MRSMVRPGITRILTLTHQLPDSVVWFNAVQGVRKNSDKDVLEYSLLELLARIGNVERSS
jgi:hypothetical protein